jgi:pyrimidine operon attenuation protein/uracil phosphoribosyltransferase
MQQSILLEGEKFQITIQRLCHQLIENHHDFANSVIIGIQPRGVLLARRIVGQLKEILNTSTIASGELDITFFRDDFRTKGSLPLSASSTNIDFIVENKKVVLIDDVLWTGRTIRAALDALQAFGRPQKVELLVLVDRRYSRHLPIEPDYVGFQIDSINSQKVIVSWNEIDGVDQVILLNEKKEPSPNQ